MISVLLLITHRALVVWCCTIFFSFTNNLISVLGACTDSDHQALLQFQASLASYNHSTWTPWNTSSTSDCCTWQGVTCDDHRSSRVTGLELSSLNISGTIPASLASLSSLQTLNLSDNNLHGELPTNLIRSLPILETLDLSKNSLHSRLSDLLPFPPSLKSVNLSYNRFYGELPSNFSNSIQELRLAKNNLSGFNNPSLLCGNSGSLRVLDLSRNAFNGALSSGFGFCASLQELSLAFNKYNGSIPQEIFSLAKLSSLSLDNNSFTGAISSNLSTSLTRLTLSNNFFSGPLPKILPYLRNLVTLDLSNNNISGFLSDTDFSNLTSLQVLNLYFNSFTGTIPVSLSNCKSLKVLDLALNFLTGYVPREFNTLKSLTFVSLSANKLNGSLQSFQDCNSLVSLYLAKNNFAEPLPTTMNLHNLQVLALGFLNLKGGIPLWLKNCTKLQVLDLSWNSFEGQLPPWLGSFQHLIYLDLSNNTLTGSIPLQLFYLPSLVKVDTNFTGLQIVMDPVQVGHHSGLPDLTYFRALSLPPSILLGNNGLTGSIPSPNVTINVLAVLDLSHNGLTGNIPDSLSRIKNLEQLDLSSNRLTGNIPSSLSKLTFLSKFNVSFNNLVGPIPLNNQFGTFTNTSYTGNPGLCGAPVLSPCSISSSNNSSSNTPQPVTKKRMIAILVTICALVGFAAISVTIFLVCMISGRTAVHHGYGNSSEISDGRCVSEAQHATVQLLYNDQKVTVGDIFHGTNNFNANNIVGCGGYGLVYRADLEDGSKLAIKKLTGDCGQMEREFKAEVEALSKARHKNLVPLKGFMQIGHSKLLIYAYMENGSLDYWLHERTDGAACLDWPTRLKIAHGAAAGLAYLHQICNPHIVHRDIKSSNILLDEVFEARLADFGLARLMMSTDTHVTTELVGTLGYIPPEYSEKSNATPRGDVYSFGVVLLELLTGKRPVDVCGSKESSDLISWVQQLKHTARIDEVFDKPLRERGFEEQMRKVLDIALLCINREPQKRPSIKEVVFLLEEVRQTKHVTAET